MVLTGGEMQDDAESGLACLDAADGTVRWKVKTSEDSYNGFPQLMRVDGNELIMVGTARGGVILVHLADGGVFWEWHPAKADPSMFHFSTAGPTLSVDGRIVVASNKPQKESEVEARGCVRLFDNIGKKPTTPVWEYDNELQLTQVCTVVPKKFTGACGRDLALAPFGHQICGGENDKNVITKLGPFRGEIIALDMETGKVQWTFIAPPVRSCYSAGMSQGDQIPPDAFSNVILDSRGTGYVTWQGGFVFAINCADGSELSRYETGTTANGTPTMAPGMLVVEGFDRIICWHDSDLEDEWIAENKDDPRAFKLESTCHADATKEAGFGKLMFERPLDEDLTILDGPPAAGPCWIVVGGVSSGGIVVRRGEGTKTEELGRVGTGARLLEKELVGERLHYQRLSGDGPAEGWVSLKFKATPLVERQ